MLRLVLIGAFGLAGSAAAWSNASLNFWLAQKPGNPANPLAGDPRVISEGVDAAALYAGQVESAELDKVTANARKAMRIEPLWISGVRNLALSSRASQTPEWFAQMKLAEGINRRDAVVESGLYDNAILQGDFAGALIHADRIMLVRPRNAEAMFPILNAMAEEPSAFDELARKGDRAWFREWISAAYSKPESVNLDAVTAVMLATKINFGSDYPWIVGAVLRSLDRNQKYGLLRQSAIGAGGAKPDQIAEFGFSETTTRAELAPVAWKLVSNGSDTAQWSEMAGLDVSLKPSSSVGVLERVTWFAPGNYQLSQSPAQPLSGAVPDMQWHMNCMVAGSPQPWRYEAPSARVEAGFEVNVAISPSCPIQRWHLRAVTGEGQVQSQFSIANVDLRVSRP